MKASDNTMLICELCGERAVHEHAHPQYRSMVCRRCDETLKARGAYEDHLADISALETGRRYDEALALLDRILEANQHLDHDLWLVRSIASHRALMLWEAGRYSEAEDEWHARARLGFADVEERWEQARGLARVLEDQGRPQEALVVLEESLGHEDPEHISGAVAPLGLLARVSQKLGQPVHPKWLRLTQDVAASYGVGAPAGESLAEAILKLEREVAGMLPKAEREAAALTSMAWSCPRATRPVRSSSP
jgi:tetratricopeptide (TPR) repeat protein